MHRHILLAVILATATTSLLAQQSEAPFYADKMNLMVYRDVTGQEHPVRTPADWQKRRAHILANMQLVMGPLPDASKKVPIDIRVLEEVALNKVIRRKITFAVEKNDRVPAYVLIPKDLKGKVPAILCLHQTTPIGKAEPAGLGGKPNLRYGLELAQRGYVTLAPDYSGNPARSFGDYKCDPYAMGYVSSTMKGIWNHMRAIDLLQSLPEVDGNRIGCIGHSLGGHNTMFVAVFDQRIKVMVSSCGFNSFFKYHDGDLTDWSGPGYMPRIATVYEKDPQKMPFDFTELVGALAPRALFISAPKKDCNFEVSGVQDCVKAAKPVYRLLGGPANLAAVYPDAEHDFPPRAREDAYSFIEKALRR